MQKRKCECSIFCAQLSTPNASHNHVRLSPHLHLLLLPIFLSLDLLLGHIGSGLLKSWLILLLNVTKNTTIYISGHRLRSIRALRLLNDSQRTTTRGLIVDGCFDYCSRRGLANLIQQWLLKTALKQSWYLNFFTKSLKILKYGWRLMSVTFQPVTTKGRCCECF